MGEFPFHEQHSVMAATCGNAIASGDANESNGYT